MKQWIILLPALLLCLHLSGQTVTGRIMDSENHPVDAASIVLQQPDSTFIEAVLSEVDGNFHFSKRTAFPCRLIVQHLSFSTKTIDCKKAEVGTIVLETRTNNLKEWVVTAERPFVKVESGSLNYDLDYLSKGKAVNNVYEALQELPGVEENEGSLSLSGASQLSIIINGKPSTINSSELVNMLRSMPVERVQKVEVLYSAPPQYHVRGAAINIVLKRTIADSVSGEIKSSYTHRYANSGSIGTNFRISTPKMAFDVIYDASDSKAKSQMTLDSRHTFQNKIYNIIQHQHSTFKGWDHTLRAAYEYNFSEKSNASITYNGSFSPDDTGQNYSGGNFQQSHIENRNDSYMHNFSAQYQSAFGLNLTLDYTNYHSTNSQQFQNTTQDTTNFFLLDGGQRVEKLSFSADQEHHLKNNWTLGYGFSYAYASDKDFQYYSKAQGDIETQNTDSKLTEQTSNIYMRTEKTFAHGQNLSLSLSGEYYTIRNYHKWAVYPRASWTFFSNPKHTFILSLSSNKYYPSYWSRQASISYLDGYAEIHGTPDLRPSNIYQFNVTYLLSHKYTFNLFYLDIKDGFTQTGYQSSKRLALIYQMINWNYSRQLGGVVNIPYKITNWFNTRLETVVLKQHQRCDNFFDVPFNRAKWLTHIGLDNTFTASKQLSFNLNASYTSPSIQGTYNLTHYYRVSASAQWNFLKKRATVTAQMNDIFNSGMPKVRIRYKNQDLDMNNSFYMRSFTIAFSYRFGGYKAKNHKNVDTSRFGH